MSLRKMLLIALAVTFMLTSAALFAQVLPPGFSINATQFQVRHHGQTEVLGDVLLTCTSTGTFPVNSTIMIVYNPTLKITNAASDTFSSASNVTYNAREAYIESETNGPNTGGGNNITVGDGTLNTTIASISFPVSGTANVGDKIRIMGIRGDIWDTGLAATQTIQAYVTPTPPDALTITNVGNESVALVLDEIKVTSPGPVTLAACITKSQYTTVNVSELMVAALTTVTDENDSHHTPTGLGGETVTHSTKGTTLTFKFTGITPGLTVTAPCDSGGILHGDSGFTMACPSTLSVDGTSGNSTATFTYTTVSDNPGFIDDIDFEFEWSVNTGNLATPITSNQAVGTVTLGPASTTAVGDPTASLKFYPNPLPSGTGDDYASLIPCRTNLLCKFISTVTGYDTGIAIANTSMDIWNSVTVSKSGRANSTLTATQGGQCRATFYEGGVASTPFVIASVVPGSDYTFLATQAVGANFTGYAIVQCDFQFAHAEVIVADTAFSSFAHGYDCLVIPDPELRGGRFADDSGSRRNHNYGEGLNQ